MTTGNRIDPVPAFNFVISLLDSPSQLMSVLGDIRRAPIAGFSECTGLESTIDVEEYKEGGNNSGVLKFATRTTHSAITLRRGVGLNNDLWEWHNGFVLGRGKRRDGLIILQDEDHKAVRSWRIRRALPIKYSGPSLNANQSAVAIEELQIAHEGLELVSAPGGATEAFLGAVQNAASALGNSLRS